MVGAIRWVVPMEFGERKRRLKRRGKNIQEKDGSESIGARGARAEISGVVGATGRSPLLGGPKNCRFKLYFSTPLVFLFFMIR